MRNPTAPDTTMGKVWPAITCPAWFWQWSQAERQVTRMKQKLKESKKLRKWLACCQFIDWPRLHKVNRQVAYIQSILDREGGK